MKLVLLFSFLSLAAGQDIRSGKISNRLIILGMVFGGCLQVLQHHAEGIYFFLRNISVPIILFYLLFQMRVLGAGDIKLFSMMGSILTIQELCKCIVYGFLAAGAGSAFCLIVDRRRWQRMQYAFWYLAGIFSCGKIEPYQPPYEEEQISFAFAVPVLFGAVAALFCG